MAAGIWCVRLGLHPQILESGDELGGQLRHVFSPVPDYPGIPATTGPGLAERFADHVRQLSIAVETGVHVERIDVNPRRLLLDDGREVRGDAMILATGVARRRLEVPGEDRFRGRGLSYSVSKELGTFGGGEVVVVGGGDAAFEGALLLVHECERIHLVYRGATRVRPDFRRAAEREARIQIHSGRGIAALEGQDRPTGVLLEGGQRIPCERIFVRIGVEPRIPEDGGLLPRDDRGYLVVDRRNRCREGIYAVGDVCSPDAMSVSVAVGHAMIACKHIQGVGL